MLRAATEPDAEQDQGRRVSRTLTIITHFFLGPHDFNWAVLPHVGHFLESDVIPAAYLYNSPLHGTSGSSQAGLFKFDVSHVFQTVRSVPDDVKLQCEPKHQPPFLVCGAQNVILETIKRGDDDKMSGSGPKTIVLRLYEAFGGHATVKLLISSSIGVRKVIITNLLEDDYDEALLFWAAAEEEVEQGYSQYVKLSFRGFEVKTLKLTLGSGVKK